MQAFLLLLMVTSLVSSQSSDSFCALNNHCAEIRQAALRFSVDMLCIEQLKACVEVYYCIDNDGCDCTQKEQCIQGQCQPTTTTRDCNTTRVTIQANGNDEEVAADPDTVYTIVGVVTLFLAFGVLFTLVLICQWHITARRTQGVA